MGKKLDLNYFYGAEADQFNAPSTMGAFYQAEVNHDMAYGACEA